MWTRPDHLNTSELLSLSLGSFLPCQDAKATCAVPVASAVAPLRFGDGDSPDCRAQGTCSVPEY